MIIILLPFMLQLKKIGFNSTSEIKWPRSRQKREYSIRLPEPYFLAPTLFFLDTPTNDTMEDSAWNCTKRDTSLYFFQDKNVADTLKIIFYYVFIGIYLTSKRRK